MNLNLGKFRSTLFITALLLILPLTSCTISSSSDAEDSEQNSGNNSGPYQRITLLVSDYTLSNEETLASNETLKKNLMCYYNLSDEKAEQLIADGKFELRLVEAGGEKLDESFQCGYNASTIITVWKSEDYFAVCSSGSPNFTPFLATEREISLVGGNAWSDAEEGYLKPKTKPENIVIVIGRTIGIQTENAVLAPTHLYMDKILIAYEPFPVNENGETYGSLALADNVEEDPDLIAAVGIDGTEGYVRKEDFEEEMPKTTTEAIALMSLPIITRQVPLYESDGETVIGVFEISDRDASEQ